MDIAWIIVFGASAWMAVAMAVAVVIGGVVRRGDEDAQLYGSLAVSTRAWVSRYPGADPTGALPTTES